MSTIRTDTLQNAAGTKSVPVATVVDGSAKAWVNFNGTGTVAIRAAFNVSSITDNGVGNYTLNFATAMADADYAMAGNQLGGASTSASGARSVCPITFSTTSLRIINTSGTGAAEDSTYVTVAIFR